MCESLDISFDDIDCWLQENRSKLYDDSDKLFDEINTDVYGKALKNEIDEKKLVAWEKKVDEWRDRYVKLLDEFWEERSKF